MIRYFIHRQIAKCGDLLLYIKEISTNFLMSKSYRMFIPSWFKQKFQLPIHSTIPQTHKIRFKYQKTVQLFHEQLINLNNSERLTKKKYEKQPNCPHQSNNFQVDKESDEQKNMKLINLKVIQLALQNTLEALEENKQRELLSLQKALQQACINLEVYEQKKINDFEKWFMNQKNQVQSVKKNILKGYHQAKKAIFDALNEFLDQERPFGIWSKPFPWKKLSCFSHHFNQHEQQDKLKSSAQKVLDACSYVCGLLLDKEDNLLSTRYTKVDMERIRKDRISRMLADEMVQSQQRWIFYDKEETQLLIQVEKYIFNQIIIAFVGQIPLIAQNFPYSQNKI